MKNILDMRLNKKGFTLFELLIMLSLSSIVSMGIIKEVRNIKSKERIIQELRRNKIIQIKINSLVNPYLIKIGSWSAFNNYKITNKETEKNNFLNEQSLDIDFLKSNIISIINFDTESYFIKINDNYCLKGKTFGKKSFFALIFNKSSWIEVEVKLNKNGNCYKLEDIKTYESPFKSSNDVSLTKEQSILLPVIDSYSLFVDKNDTLRKISHQNNYHQPIEYNVSKFEIYEDKIILEKNESIELENNKKTLNALELFAMLYSEERKPEEGIRRGND